MWRMQQPGAMPLGRRRWRIKRPQGPRLQDERSTRASTSAANQAATRAAATGRTRPGSWAGVGDLGLHEITELREVRLELLGEAVVGLVVSGRVGPLVARVEEGRIDGGAGLGDVVAEERVLDEGDVVHAIGED